MQTKRWTPHELLYITDNYLTQTDTEIAKYLGRSTEAVSLVRCRKLKFYRGWSPDELGIIWDNSDKTAAELAEMLPGRTVKAVEQQRWRLTKTSN